VLALINTSDNRSSYFSSSNSNNSNLISPAITITIIITMEIQMMRISSTIIIQAESKVTKDLPFVVITIVKSSYWNKIKVHLVSLIFFTISMVKMIQIENSTAITFYLTIKETRHFLLVQVPKRKHKTAMGWRSLQLRTNPVDAQTLPQQHNFHHSNNSHKLLMQAAATQWQRRFLIEQKSSKQQK